MLSSVPDEVPGDDLPGARAGDRPRGSRRTDQQGHQAFPALLLPKGCALDWHTMNVIVKGFHLAFKGMETEEIYDILMEQLVATVKGYDPTYTDKVKLLVEAIEHGLSNRKQFSFADVNRHLDFDCDRYIRLLGRLGFVLSEAQRPAGSSSPVNAPPTEPYSDPARKVGPFSYPISLHLH